jgi:hypothetical protein
MQHPPFASLFARSLGLAPLAAFLCFALLDPASAQTRFSGADTTVVEEARPGLPPGGRLLRLRIGEIVEVHRAGARLFGAGKETAFYVPLEGRGLVSVSVKKARGRRTYFIKALAPGETLGGVVPRPALDRAGLDPKDDAAHALIQLALKTAPVVFVILPEKSPVR